MRERRRVPETLDGVTPDDEKVVYSTLLGSEVRCAYIFRAQQAPQLAAGAPA